MEKKNGGTHPVVLGIDPHVRGIGFAVFEGPRDIIDWGTTSTSLGKTYNAKRRVSQLIATRQPDVLVVEDMATARRGRSSRKRIATIEKLAAAHGITCVKYSAEDVRMAFSNFGAVTKYEIAAKLASFMPELEGYLPSKRQIWEAEDPHYSIFDAAAFAFTYYFTRAQ